MSTTTRRERLYTQDDLADAVDYEQAKWRSEAINGLRACLHGTQDGQSPKRPAEAAITWKTYKR